MKLAVTVLASILFACSVTTATPVNPSLTTSAESSTSAVTPNAQATSLFDLSQPSLEVMNLLEEYAQSKEDYKEAEKVYDLVHSTKSDRKQLVKQLREEYQELLDKYQEGDGSKYKDESEKLEKEEDILIDLLQRRAGAAYFSLYERLKSDPKFTKIIDSFHISISSQQSISQQASTSGTRSSSQHHESPSSSNEIPTVELTETFSNIQEAVFTFFSQLF
ncbi:hypothetical protein BDEG_26907 [Batrachochytrium dendrobatidis JEL423]|uniref:Uncharacterized protein n=1 Tax=Batrachochytrium dendrobatidis (strain JEL423) TaxID=403673 RepID=A0A177WTX1_BATDL|nr:hypothetical protein BDEG_26907 [Batrachochytrium dendrobatidis JEL423]